MTIAFLIIAAGIALVFVASGKLAKIYDGIREW